MIKNKYYLIVAAASFLTGTCVASVAFADTLTNTTDLSLPAPVFTLSFPHSDAPNAQPQPTSSGFWSSFDCLPPDPHPFYVGGILGYGNTNWSQMVSQDSASANSTPISAGGSGVMVGAFAGYELTSHFAVEANYMRFPSANIKFEPDNVYGIDSFTSYTNEYGVMGKFMVPIGSSKFKAFSEVGPAYVQRDDILAKEGKIGAGFGLGVDYNINQRWMSELGFQYYTGFGASEFKPVYDYIPFLYTLNLRIAYRFSLF